MINQLERKPPYELIRDALIEEYLGDESRVGEKLPSDRHLAARFGVSVATVSKGISSLVANGHLERRVGAGTFIREIEAQQPAVAIYLGASADSYTTPTLRFYGLLDEMLQTELSRGAGVQHYADMRIPVSQGQPMPALMKDVKAGNITDLIVCRANASDFWWLEKLATRVIGCNVDLGGHLVGIDYAAFARGCSDYLKSVGCRSVGLISAVPHVTTERVPSYGHFFDALNESFERCELKTDERWVVCQEVDDSKVYDARHEYDEELGYRGLKKLWSCKQRPEGLIVHHDAVGLGVAKAAKDLGIDLCKDIKTIFHSNMENEWPELAPYPRMSYSIKEVSSALLSCIGKEGRQVKLVRPQLVVPVS